MDKKTRFFSKVDIQPNGCWLWTGNKRSSGYGYFHLQSKPRKGTGAHRFAYELIVGPIPEGLDLDHLCRVRHCVNPAHLEPVTRSENLRRSPGLMGRAQREKTHCKHGHPLSGDNVQVSTDGKRRCRACGRERMKGYRSDIHKSPSAYEEYKNRGREIARASRERKKGTPLSIPNWEKTHCNNGHPLSGDNLWVDSKNSRRCRACRREACNRAYRKRKERELRQSEII